MTKLTMLDLVATELGINITIRGNGKVVWVNIGGITLRVKTDKPINIEDERNANQNQKSLSK